ncbi:MAG: hypothetical protein L0Z62_03750 [Gemmataceae bacterium]|nr:hypothetical protein [Gemmataceae bacterium]
MWNSKRILLLGLGFALFLAGYVVYAYFLGGIDGLPPLPAPLRPSAGGGDSLPPPPSDNKADQKLRIAYDTDVKAEIKLEIPKKGLVLATDSVSFEPDGRVKLTPLKLAIFSDEKGDCRFPEINTVSCDVAFLTFDQPITNPLDMGNRKILGAELKGKVTIINNRRTPQKNDDIEVLVDEESLHYDEKQNKVWTKGHVKLLDTATRPHPTDISGKGLELYLVKQEPDGKGGKKPRPATRTKGDPVGGVERVVLLSSVEMHLYPESGGFPSPGKDSKPAPAPKAPDKGPKESALSKSHVVIRTQGRFVYDVTRDLATFESPPDGGKTPEQVVVLREAVRDKTSPKDPQKDGLLDQLLCDHLELQFRRKKGLENTEARDSRGGDREIDSARATARPGREVWLVMDTENLAANCSELTYHSPKPGSGARTCLQGQPMEAVKDGHKIKARELLLIGSEKKGEGQRLEAVGPGQVDLFDRASAARNPDKSHPVHAFWKDRLVSTRDREGDRDFDLLTFTGDAVFLDEEHDQELQGQKLMVWLESNDRAAAPAPRSTQDSQNSPRQKLHKVEAFESVKARSAEMKIHHCNHLLVRFEEGMLLLPEAVATATPAGPGAHTVGRHAIAGNPELLAAPKEDGPARTLAGPGGKDGTPKPGTPEKQKKPIELWGRDVIVMVTRTGEKNELRDLLAEGEVHVRQEGAKPEDKGVDIKGEILKLTRSSSGDILDVWGDARERARLQLGEMILIAPKVRIDQQKNLTFAEGGDGGMDMPSNTTFDGGKPTRPGTRLRVEWTRDMLFNGKDADFRGDVVAYQDNAALKCQTLQVTLDKFVSFKEGQKGGQGAKVEKLVAHGRAYIVESQYDDSGKLVKYQRLVTQQVAANNLDGRLIASNEVKLFSLQYGAKDLAAAPGAGKPAPAPSKPSQDEEMKLTRVYAQDMTSYEVGEKIKTRISKFFGNVEVLHLAADEPDVKVDLEKLPKGALYMQSELLTVASKPLPNGKQTQEMTAERRVFFRTQEFFGRADVVKYNEAQDTVIFQGNPAILYRQKRGVRGREYEEIKSKTILYNRKTGVFILDGGEEIKVGQANPPDCGMRIAECGLKGPSSFRIPHSAIRNRAGSLAVAGLNADRQDQALAVAAFEQQARGDHGRQAGRGQAPQGQGHGLGRDARPRLVARDDG